MDKFKYYLFLPIVSVVAVLTSNDPAMASNWVDRTQLSGFFSSTYSITDEAEYFNGGRGVGINDDGSFQGTKLSLNIRSEVNDQVTVAAQIFSAIQEEDYATHLDWAFASFSLSDNVTLRTGKIKYPVGLVNEYVDVGITYPWIQAPVVIYSEEAGGAQATREAYTGVSLLGNRQLGSWELSGDLFAGEVNLEGMNIKGMLGITARAEWNEIVQLQASAYNGEMKPDDPTLSMMTMAMNNKEHKAVLAGVKVDWNNFITYVESASVEMDFKMAGVTVGNSDSWYGTVGYRFGKFLPHFTYQDWDRDNGNGNEISTIGLNYSLSHKTVIKAEFSQIDTVGAGLFEATPSDNSTDMFSASVNLIF